MPSDEALKLMREAVGRIFRQEGYDYAAAEAATDAYAPDLAEIIDRHMPKHSWRETFDAGARSMRVKAAYLARGSGFSDGAHGTIEGQIASAILDMPLPPHPDGPPDADLAALLVEAAEMIDKIPKYAEVGGGMKARMLDLVARLRKAAEEME